MSSSMLTKSREIGKIAFILPAALLLVATILWSFDESNVEHLKDDQTGMPGAVAKLDVLSELTKYAWHYSNQNSLSPEGFVLSFFNNGTFRWSVVSDHSEVREGVWGYKEPGNDIGLLFMLTRANSPTIQVASGPREEVFPLKVRKDNLLLLGPYLLRPAGTPPTQTGQLRSSAIKEVINEKNFPNYFRLTERAWSKLGTKDNNFMADLLTMLRDGTFTASYQEGECRHSGYWSLEGSQIFLELPPDHCDERGYRNPIVRGYYYTFDGSSLLLDRTYRYSPSE